MNCSCSNWIACWVYYMATAQPQLPVFLLFELDGSCCDMPKLELSISVTMKFAAWKHLNIHTHTLIYIYISISSWQFWTEFLPQTNWESSYYSSIVLKILSNIFHMSFLHVLLQKKKERKKNRGHLCQSSLAHVFSLRKYILDLYSMRHTKQTQV